MYTDTLFPSGFLPYGDYDISGPQTFANTDEGILGLDICFEVRPYGYESVYDSSNYGNGGSQAIRGVGANAINRSQTNNVDVSNTPGDPWLTLATKDQSASPVWVINKQGTGGLSSNTASPLKSILNGAPHTQNCDGLMYSFSMGVATRSKYVGQDYATPFGTDATTPFPGTLFSNSNNTTPSVTPSQSQHLRKLRIANAPQYPSGAFNWGFWTLLDATTYGGYPARLI